MPTLSEIFDKRKIFLYQNESLDLDHYYGKLNIRGTFEVLARA